MPIYSLKRNKTAISVQLGTTTAVFTKILISQKTCIAIF